MAAPCESEGLWGLPSHPILPLRAATWLPRFSGHSYMEDTGGFPIGPLQGRQGFCVCVCGGYQLLSTEGKRSSGPAQIQESGAGVRWLQKWLREPE